MALQVVAMEQRIGQVEGRMKGTEKEVAETEKWMTTKVQQAVFSPL
jgi:hypothetical protein